MSDELRPRFSVGDEVWCYVRYTGAPYPFRTTIVAVGANPYFRPYYGIPHPQHDPCLSIKARVVETSLVPVNAVDLLAELAQ